MISRQKRQETYYIKIYRNNIQIQFLSSVIIIIIIIIIIKMCVFEPNSGAQTAAVMRPSTL